MLSAANTRISGDLHGAISRQIERQVDAALMANGAVANISTRFTRRTQEPPEVMRLAKLFLRQAARARFRPIPDPTLSTATCPLRLSVRNYKAVKIRSRKKAGRLAVVAQEALETLNRLRLSATFRRKNVSTSLTVLRIADITLAALPFEIYADTGDFLWAKARVVTVGYANGYWGYLPSRKAAQDDYEAVSSAFDTRADQVLRRAILAAVKPI